MKSFLVDKKYSKLFSNESDAREFVTELYRRILYREPDHSGQMKYVEKLRSGKLTPGEMISAFMNSPEGEARRFADVWDKRTTIYRMEVNEELDIVRELFVKTSRYWKNIGFNENEIYFSVLSSPQMKRKLSDKDIQGFYNSGNDFVDFCLQLLKKEKVVNFENMSCLDFGAGVGRLAFRSSLYFKKVYAVDFSQGHLDVLNNNMEKFPSLHENNIIPILLSGIEDIENKIPKNVDFIYSFITLQHNTPPVMVSIIKKLFGALKKDGYAILHIPIHHPFYVFSASDYLMSEKSGTNMEMHILPRENIREVAISMGVTLCDSYGYGGTKGVYSELFLFRKNY